MALRADLSTVTSFVNEVAKDVAETKGVVKGIQGELRVQRADLDAVTGRVTKMEAVTSALAKRLEKVDEMGKAIEAQGKHLKELQVEVNTEVAVNAEFRPTIGPMIETERLRIDELEAQRYVQLCTSWFGKLAVFILRHDPIG